MCPLFTWNDQSALIWVIATFHVFYPHKDIIIISCTKSLVSDVFVFPFILMPVTEGANWNLMKGKLHKLTKLELWGRLLQKE